MEKLPPLRFWFGPRALFQVSAFMFAECVGVLGLAGVIDTGILEWMFGATALLAVLAWYLSAKESFAISQQETQVTRLLVALDNFSPPHDATFLENLSGASTDVLKVKVSQVASGLRALETRIQHKESLIPRVTYNPDASNDLKRHLWEGEQRQRNEIRLDVESEFQEKWLPAAQGLWDELCRRVGKPDYLGDLGTAPPVALIYGSLAGADPLGEAATWLERLARKLPNDQA